MRGKSVRKLLGWIGALAVAAAAAGYAGLLPIGRKPDATAVEHAAAPAATKPTEAIAVTVAQAAARPVERRVRAVGTLNSYEDVEIGPLVDGQVRRILHDVGDVVPPGEPLLEIADDDFRLMVQEMGRALELELAKLGLGTPPDASFDVESLPAVLRARIVEKNAADTLERYKSLVDRNAITKDDFQKAEMNLDVARLDTKQRLIEAEQSLASVRHRQAILETAQKRLNDTRVVVPPLTLTAGGPQSQINLVSMAPSAGAQAPAYTVAERFVAEGEIVRAAPPTKLFRLVVEDPLKFQSAVPERFASQVRVGQTVELGVESLPGRKLEGRVVRISPTVDTANRTFQVEVSVRNGERLLKPGSFATASILIGTDAQAVTVPEEAIMRFAGVTKVFAVSGDQAVVVPVETGTRLEIADVRGTPRRWVEIVGGVAAGASVVTTGHAQLAEGTPVRVREALPPPGMPQGPLDADAKEARRMPQGAVRKEAR
ncbi:MAG: efflux RND transporter periplasmic adaptor subunit [Planctomycetaceae bacterium]|nr:efflux RND transporter periplasmic adaptor subunit [Planctomycetaceae bacterium]